MISSPLSHTSLVHWLLRFGHRPPREPHHKWMCEARNKAGAEFPRALHLWSGTRLTAVKKMSVTASIVDNTLTRLALGKWECWLRRHWRGWLQGTGWAAYFRNRESCFEPGSHHCSLNLRNIWQLNRVSIYGQCFSSDRLLAFFMGLEMDFF